MTPTREEQNAINALKRLAKRWPKTLWLFSGSGDLCVMRYGPDGECMMDGLSVDQEYILATIDIPNDGGGVVMCEHDYNDDTMCPWCISIEVMLSQDESVLPLQDDEERIAGYHPDLISETERDEYGRLKKRD